MHCNKQIKHEISLSPWYRQVADVYGAKNVWWVRKLFYLLFAFGGSLCFNMGLGMHTCFSCCIELKGEADCREYWLQIKGSDNAAFFEGQRNTESRLNTLQYVNATPRMLDLRLSAAGGQPVVCILFWMEYCLLQQSNCPAPIVLVMSWSISHYWT